MEDLFKENVRSITPYLTVYNCLEAIEFYKKIFKAKELYKLQTGNRVDHAELLIGNSIIMIADNNPLMANTDARRIIGMPISLCIYVDNVDDAVKYAESLGATIETPPENQFYGDRMASIIDPFGFKWAISTKIEDLSNDEITQRYKLFVKKMQHPNEYEKKYHKYLTKYMREMRGQN